MRLDKYIWAVRLAKTRAISSELIKKNKVKLDGVDAKAAKDVEVGSIIDIKRKPHYRSYKVLEIPKSRVGAKLVSNFIRETTDERLLNEIKLLELENRTNRQKGLIGRPTKKDRRKLDDLNRQ